MSPGRVRLLLVSLLFSLAALATGQNATGRQPHGPICDEAQARSLLNRIEDPERAKALRIGSFTALRHHHCDKQEGLGLIKDSLSAETAGCPQCYVLCELYTYRCLRTPAANRTDGMKAYDAYFARVLADAANAPALLVQMEKPQEALATLAVDHLQDRVTSLTARFAMKDALRMRAALKATIGKEG